MMLKKMKKMLIYLSLLSAICLVLGSCAPAEEASGDTIKIATVGPITGDAAVWGTQQQQGVELAIDDINANGGLLGKQVELVPLDDKGDPKEAVSVAQRIVDDPSISAVIGHLLSGSTIAAGPIYTKGKVPLMAVAATNPKVVEEGGEYVFRINMSDATAGADMASYVVGKLGKKKIAVLRSQDEYAQGVFEAFKARAEELGATIVSDQKFVAGQDKDFSVMLTNIKKVNPDLIFADTLAADAALIAQQKATLGIDTPLIIPDGATEPTFIELAGEAAEGTIAFSYFDPTIDDPKIAVLMEKYRNKYGREILTYVPYAYDAMMAIAEAIKIANSTDREAIRDALEQVSYPDGVTGVISFKNRDRAVGWSVVLKVENGKFVYVEKSN